MQLSAVILAGGQSRRMGRDKSWEEYQGKSWIAAAVEKVRRLGIEEMFISGRLDQDYSAFKCRVLADEELGLGPISGIEQALRASISSLVLVLPVDLPKMTAECLRKLIHTCGRFTGAVAKVDGRIESLVAVYPKRCHDYALMNMARGDYAVHHFASACLREHAVRVFRVSPSDAACFVNCNTPQDLADLQAAALDRIKGDRR